jgi:hypothetical protein
VKILRSSRSRPIFENQSSIWFSHHVAHEVESHWPARVRHAEKGLPATTEPVKLAPPRNCVSMDRVSAVKRQFTMLKDPANSTLEGPHASELTLEKRRCALHRDESGCKE